MNLVSLASKCDSLRKSIEPTPPFRGRVFEEVKRKQGRKRLVKRKPHGETMPPTEAPYQEGDLSSFVSTLENANDDFQNKLNALASIARILGGNLPFDDAEKAEGLKSINCQLDRFEGGLTRYKQLSAQLQEIIDFLGQKI